MKRALITTLLLASLPLAACGEAKPQQGTLAKNTVSCTLLQDFLDMQTMVARDELIEFNRLLQNKLSSGECKRYLKGTDVLIDREKAIDKHNYACVRVEEEKACKWMEMLAEKP